jgi:hypothetical protein
VIEAAFWIAKAIAKVIEVIAESTLLAAMSWQMALSFLH